MINKISYTTAFLLGLGMIFLGIRFFVSPQSATVGYGIHFNEQNDYSFYYIKGIRDVFSGIIICAFVLMSEKRALGTTLLAGTIIPLTDLFIVLSKNYNSLLQALPHIIAILICAVFGMVLLVTKSQSKKL